MILALFICFISIVVIARRPKVFSVVEKNEKHTDLSDHLEDLGGKERNSRESIHSQKLQR